MDAMDGCKGCNVQALLRGVRAYAGLGGRGRHGRRHRQADRHRQNAQRLRVTRVATQAKHRLAASDIANRRLEDLGPNFLPPCLVQQRLVLKRRMTPSVAGCIRRQRC